MALTLVIQQVSLPPHAGKVGLIANVSVAGTTPYTYQWYRTHGQSITPGGGNIIAGATAVAYRGSNEPVGVVTYACVVTDAAAATSTATVTLQIRDRATDTVDVSKPNAQVNYPIPPNN